MDGVTGVCYFVIETDIVPVLAGKLLYRTDESLCVLQGLVLLCTKLMKKLFQLLCTAADASEEKGVLVFVVFIEDAYTDSGLCGDGIHAGLLQTSLGKLTDAGLEDFVQLFFSQFFQHSITALPFSWNTSWYKPGA